jgi:uncharacterized protein
MSDATFMNPLPRQIDPRKFAQQGIEIAGSVELSALTRAKELLFSDKGNVEVELSFDIGEQRILYVAGKIKAKVENVCQRCLEAVPVNVDCELNLAIQWEDSDLDRLPSRFEPWIVGEGQTDIYQIIEDEILLSLPIVSYHDEECIPHSLFSSGEAEAQKVIAAGPSTNPFTALQGLKESLQSSDTLDKKEK